MRREEKFESEVESLIKKLKDDLQSGVPENLREKNVPIEPLIYNLFVGKYDFSYEMFKEIMKRLKKE